MRPSSCWACHAMFETNDWVQEQVFRLIQEQPPERVREFVDEVYSREHENHSESWV